MAKSFSASFLGRSRRTKGRSAASALATRACGTWWRAFFSGVATTLFYEFCHCVQHLNHAPKSRYLQRIKRLHLAHHFHNETGNFGITNFLWDRVFGTYYDKAKQVPRSPTVFNLGYTSAEAERYPWVARLSQGTRRDDAAPRLSPAASRDIA